MSKHDTGFDRTLEFLGECLVVNDLDKGSRISTYISEESARWLRDELDKFYPPEVEAGEYYAQKTVLLDSAPWEVHRCTTKRVNERVANAFSEEDAKRIVKALNEAEGL